MTKAKPALADHDAVLADFWRACTEFDFDLLRQVTAPDSRFWWNTSRMGRRAASVDELIDELLSWERDSGMHVTNSDVRRYVAGDVIVQQDVATVTRGAESFSFARCFVIQLQGGKVHRMWEYYDAASTGNWATNSPPLIVPA